MDHLLSMEKEKIRRVLDERNKIVLLSFERSLISQEE